MSRIEELSRTQRVRTIFNREIKRMESECGNSCEDWYEEEMLDIIEANLDDSCQHLNLESFEIDMINKADDYIEAERSAYNGKK